MLELNSESEHLVTGRGKVFVINLRQNNIPQTRPEFNKVLPFASNVKIDGNEYEIRGIEAFATHDDYVHFKIGINVK